MGGVIDGNPVNAAYTNPKFLDADGDDTALGKLTLSDIGLGSGSSITNIQKEFNSVSFWIGRTVNGSLTNLPAFTNNQGFGSDNVLTRVDSISAKFHSTTGHVHTGNPGDAPQVQANTIANTPLASYATRGTDLSAVTGSSTDVSSTLTGKAQSAASNILGVVVNAPYNKIILRQATGAATGDAFLDAFGNVVYGRLTWAASVWTLSFYVDLSGTETAYSFASASDIAWYYQELFNPLNNPPVYSENFFMPSDNATQDVVDASTTQRGLVNTGTQSLAGAKTLTGNLTLQAKLIGDIVIDSSTTGSTAALPAPSKMIVELTNASLASIGTITGGIASQFFTAVNNTGSDVIIKSYVGSNGIYTGTGQDITFKADSAALFVYVSALAGWFVVSGSGGGGSAFQEAPTGTVNGVNTTFGPLTYLPTSTDSVLVTIDGIVVPKTEYSVSVATITLTTAPALGQSVYVYYSTNGSPSLPSFSGIWKTEYRTLTGGEIAAKQLTLASLPSSPSEILLDVIGNCAQFYGDDFTVSASIVSWSGLGLDGILTAGDKLRIGYVN